MSNTALPERRPPGGRPTPPSAPSATRPAVAAVRHEV